MTDPRSAQMTALADELVKWVEGYALKVCPGGCLPTPHQEREINLFARITVALRASSTPAPALEPFVAFAKHAVDAEGWTGTVQNERIVDWFGPSEFRALSLSLPLPVRASEWMPIESAPKDGTKVLVAEAGYWLAVAAYIPAHSGWIETEASGLKLNQPTHWMPLPAIPSQERQATGGDA